jgi:flagellar hook assembly protein FlgD
MPLAGQASVAIYDARGVRVATLLDREERTAGTHTVAWNGTDDAGRTAGSGVYFARLTAAGTTSIHKLLLLK